MPKLNMKAVLGYLNQSEWLYLLNIGNIMQITPMTVQDLYTNTSFEIELTRDSILEKVSIITPLQKQERLVFWPSRTSASLLSSASSSSSETQSMQQRETRKILSQISQR